MVAGGGNSIGIPSVPPQPEEQQAEFNMEPVFTRALRKERNLTERHTARLQQKDLRAWMGANLVGIGVCEGA